MRISHAASMLLPSGDGAHGALIKKKVQPIELKRGLKHVEVKHFKLSLIMRAPLLAFPYRWLAKLRQLCPQLGPPHTHRQAQMYDMSKWGIVVVAHMHPS